MTLPNEDTRNRFDHDHGGTANVNDAAQIVAWLRTRGTYAELEDSGDLYRIWVPSIEGYFWPEDATAERWINAA